MVQVSYVYSTGQWFENGSVVLELTFSYGPVNSLAFVPFLVQNKLFLHNFFGWQNGMDHQNVKLTKCQVDKMTIYKMVSN
jgi:hypothetical protein